MTGIAMPDTEPRVILDLEVESSVIAAIEPMENCLLGVVLGFEKAGKYAQVEQVVHEAVELFVESGDRGILPLEDRFRKKELGIASQAVESGEAPASVDDQKLVTQHLYDLACHALARMLDGPSPELVRSNGHYAITPFSLVHTAVPFKP